jgi:hypothetical protein
MTSCKHLAMPVAHMLAFECAHSVRRMQVGATLGTAFALATQQRAVWSVLGHAAGGTVVALLAHAATCPPKEKSEDVQGVKQKVKVAFKDVKNSMDKM